MERLQPAFYVGAGYERGAFDDSGFVSYVDSDSYTSTSTSETDNGYVLKAGVDFMKYFGIEASYLDYGEETFTAQSDGSGTVWGPGRQRERVSLDGYALHLLGRYPVAGAVTIVGKAGWWRWESTWRGDGTYYANGTGNPAVPYAFAENDRGDSFSYGAGLEYNGFKPLRITAAYSAAQFETIPANALADSEIRSIGLSLEYLF